MSNAHQDVLNAEIPQEEDKKAAYLDELKIRAKGAFQTKDLINAEKLYSRAIEVTDKEYLLYSNRCAVRLLVKKNEEALRDAKRCLNLEPTFIKAHYRKAQAMHRLEKWSDALEACTEGLSHHAGNAEIEKLKEDIQKDWDADNDRKEKLQQEANDLTVERAKPEPTRIPMTKPAAAEKKGDSGSGDKGAGSTENGMRGYKTTADGKTTSYFHTDITDEAKKLIEARGGIAPKRIDADAPAAWAPKATVGSAWNSAGTFEEKNYTKWFHEKIRSAFDGDSNDAVALPNDLPDILLTCDTVSGDSSIAVARGKVRHIHDITVELKWSFTTSDDKSGKGDIKFESDGDEDYDVNVNVDASTHSWTRQIVNEFIKSSSKGVQPFILDRIRGVEKEFKKIQP